SGLRVRVVQLGAVRTLQVLQPETRTRVLTESSEVIASGSYQVQPPTVTRVVVGAGGEAEARDFRLFVDTARESDWGLRREVFQDARDIQNTAEDPNPNFEAEIQARADEVLLEGAAKYGLSVELAETEEYRFGSAF